MREAAFISLSWFTRASVFASAAMTSSRIEVVLAFFFGGGLAFFVVRGEQKRSSSSLESDMVALRGGCWAVLWFQPLRLVLALRRLKLVICAVTSNVLGSSGRPIAARAQACAL